MELRINVISVGWTVVAILAGVLLSLSFHFFGKRNNSARNIVNGNPNHTTSMATAATELIVRPLSQNYEVFLNFRGTDTRKTFTDHLYQRLVDMKVCVFRDSEKLHVGEEIGTNLLAAIQTAKISIAIISPNYADSKWCLLELVQILKCRETMGQIVIPILYHVDPSDVRHQTGSFGERFSLQKKKHSSKVIQEWKEALEKVASLKVLELNNNADGYEGKLVKQVVEKVLTILNKTTLVVPVYLVGVENKVKMIMEMVDLQSRNDVQVLSIHGMGGIGKTTLAKFLYNQLSNQFDYCSFLENVREASMLQLQKQLISNVLKQDWPHDIYHTNEGINIIESVLKGMRILIVLDDVDHRDQVNALVGKYNWLGYGSIMIITTRNRDVLNPWQVKLSYELKELDVDQSFQLFCKYALQGGNSHSGEFETIARDIASTTGGLPLAIEVIGCLLSGKSLDFWIETLEKLKTTPNESVLLRLKISYEALTREQKEVFLDISCLESLKGELSSFMYMWDDYNYYPRSTIEVLKSLCLIKVRYGNQLHMHDQLRLLGREIVRHESGYRIERCRIVWNPKDALEVMEMNQGTEWIEALNLALDKRSEEDRFTSEQFERLTKLRLLQLTNANLVGDFKCRFLSLRWLQWYGCPSNFTATNFCPKHLVVLNLSESNITEQWGGWSELKDAVKLKVLELRECEQLKATPDLSAFRELEILDISHCKKLTIIHPLTKTLKELYVHGCEELEELPKEVGTLKELEVLTLEWSSIREVPMVEGFMTKLTTLWLRNCPKLAGLPDLIGSLTKLEELALDGCVSLTTIPESIGKLKSLSHLDLQFTNIKQLPESIGNLHNLETLWISDTPIERLPAAIGMLKKLRDVEARNLHGLTEVPMEIGELTCLERLSLDGAAISGLPNLGRLTCLRSLSLHGAPISGLPNLPRSLDHLGFSSCSMESLPNLSYLSQLRSLSLSDMDVIPELPSWLRSVSFHGCQTLSTLPSFSNMEQLDSLSIRDCTRLMEICALEEVVPSLKTLDIINCPKISKLNGLGNHLTSLSLKSCDGLENLLDLSTFKFLKKLEVVECNNIVEVRGPDTIEWLDELCIHECSSLERINGFSHLPALHILEFGNCPKLQDIDYPCVDKFTSLEFLFLYGGSPALKLPDLSKFKKLECLNVNNFEELKEIPKLQELKSLSQLSICGCKSLENLPDFSEFTNLGGLDAQGCEKLAEVRGLEKLDCFLSLYIFGCRSLQKLPKLRLSGTIEEAKSKPWWYK